MLVRNLGELKTQTVPLEIHGTMSFESLYNSALLDVFICLL